MQNNSNQNFKNAKREWNSPLNIFLSFVLVVSLLLSFVNITGAWFTDDSSTGKTISAIIKTGEANLNVYQENNTGTQTMLSKSLPTGYTQLEYIESSGTQYIDTGYNLTSEVLKYDLEFETTSSTSAFTLIGNSDDGDTNFGINFYSNQFYVGTSRWLLSGNSWTKNQKYHKLIEANNGTLTVITDGVSQSATYTSTLYKKSSIALFACKCDTKFSNSSSHAKIYQAKIYDNNVLVRNFVPAKDSSNVVGMYDLVEGKFYTNAGTGTFTAGAEQKSGSGISLAYDTTNKTNNKVDVENTNNVKLLLKNEDLGSSFGVRYKVTFYAATASGKVELSSNISGMTAPTSSNNGFVFNSTDGYYYYQNNTGTNAMFEPATSSEATSKYLMTGFSINYTNATKTLLGGNSIYMEISVESVAV